MTITGLRRSVRRDDGSAAVELALLLPVLLVAAMAFTPLIQRITTTNRVDEALGQTVRYASKALPTPIEGSVDGHCDGPRRRRSATEVAQFLETASGGLVPAAAVVVSVEQPNDAGTVEHPCQAIPGSVVTVTAVLNLPETTLDTTSATARALVAGGGQAGLPNAQILQAVAVLE